MRDKHQITEEPCEVKVSCTVLKTNGVGDNLVEFNQSGDGLVEKASGSSLCRMSFWQYVLCQVETEHLPDSNTAAAILEYRTKLKDFTDESGRQLLNGKLLQGKLMAKVANLLFNKLVEAIARSGGAQPIAKS